ncbi:hypothetical protein DL95DRAFT_412653 [Leptodontidium sp. 2 PMI_412]|nr:hypothetical protein DL95DRAFT_412653 [Leptodontidium sp. 2 PMI_412]
MAEAFGIAVGVAQLADCIARLSKLAMAFKDSQEQVGRYQMVLMSIEKSTSLIDLLAKQSNSIRAITVQVHGKSEKLTDFYSANIAAIVENVRQFLQTVDAKKSEATGVISTIKAIFTGAKKFRGRLELVLNGDHIKDLIQSAKHIESSQYMALSAVLLVQNSLTQGNWQMAFDKFAAAIVAQSESFKELEKTCRRKGTPVAYLRSGMSRRSRLAHTKGTGLETSSDVQPESHVTTGIAEPPSYEPQQQNVHNEEDAEAKPHNKTLYAFGEDIIGLPMELEDIGEEENIAMISTDGTLDMLKKPSNRAQSSSPNEHSAPTPKYERAESPDRSDSLALDEESSENFAFSDSEAFEIETATDFPFSRSSITLYDSADIDLDPEGMIFIDRAVIMDNCTSTTTADFRFCVNILIIHENGSPSLVLKEPCSHDANGCEHILVHTCSKILSERVLPCSLRVSLRQGPKLTSGAIDHSTQECPRLLVLEDCNSRSSHTLILHERGARTQYAMATSLEIVSVFGNYQNDETEPDGEKEEDISSTGDITDSHSQTEPTGHNENNTDEDGGNQEGVDPDGYDNSEVNFGLESFSRLPCIFCCTDALRPERDAEGSQALLIVRNDSFGYSCARCKGRTWVSGMRFGLTLVGAEWHMKSIW